MNHNKKKKIFFVCPSNAAPTGGVKQIYRQVDILNKLGYDAWLLLKKKSKKNIKWYSSSKIAYNYSLFKKLVYSIKNKKLSSIQKALFFFQKLNQEEQNLVESILVFPEIYGNRMFEVANHQKYVIFNQNCYYTFQHYGYVNSEENSYTHNNCLGILVASDDAYRYMKYTFPKVPLYKITLGIDHNLFNYCANKKRKISFMPRKSFEDSEQIINILKARKKIEGWELFAIDDATETEVADNLKESVLFLSFNTREGFGLPPVEAMACGCYVIGYTGQAGKEYMREEFSSEIEAGNILEFVDKIEELVILYQTTPDIVVKKAKMASDFVLKRYSMLNEYESSKLAWGEILSDRL